MSFCIRCNKIEVSEEFTRCSQCEKTHQELCKELDAKIKPVKVIKPVENVRVVKQMKDGILVTTYEVIENYHG